MLRQELQLKTYKKRKNFEDTPLFQKNKEIISFEKAVLYAAFLHAFLAVVVIITPFIAGLLGIDWQSIARPKLKQQDIEFVLVTQPEEMPINPNTPLRSDRNTRAGGIHDPNKKITPPQPALPQSAPSQQGNQQKKKVSDDSLNKMIQKMQKQVAQQPQQVKQPAKQQAQPAPAKQPEQIAQQPKQKAIPPKPNAKPVSVPYTKAPTAMKLPVTPSRGVPGLSATPSGHTASKPTGNYGGSSSGHGSGIGAPKPIIASGGYGNTSSVSSSSGTGRGSSYSPGGGNVGNPGPGNPNGPAGVDARREPNFGPYMSELQRRIKANWDPPRGDESKRVVLLFKIARDGRLLNVKVVKSSGSPAADKAALAAVELTAPFRNLPSDFRGDSVDIQFTFDYNVFGVNKF